jgi:subtilisin family serine protease
MSTISAMKRAAAPKTPAKPAPKEEAAPTAKAAEPFKVHGSIFLQLGRQADLRDLNDLPVGPERRKAAVDRMRSLASEEQEAAAPLLEKALKSELGKQGFKNVEVGVGDRLWLTDGMTMDISAEIPGLAGLFADKSKTDALMESLKKVKGVSMAVPTDQLTFKTPKAAEFEDKAASAAAESTTGKRETPWNLSMIGAPQAWRKGITGKGVTVANVDTGVDVNNPNLISHFRGYDPNSGLQLENNYFDAYAPAHKVGGKDPQPKDDVGHGTHTMGTMVGNDGSTAPIGVAPGAKFIAAKGLGKQGGDALSLLKSMQWTVAPTDNWGQVDASKGADIVNHSWGGMTPVFDFTAALRNMADAGVVNVFAAGNAGQYAKDQTLGDPGMWEDTITVGAVDKHGEVTDFSSKGPSPVTRDYKPDVVAPGHQVLSALPGGVRQAWSGTSMATPHVTGALALVDQALAKKGQTPLDLDDAKFVLKRMTKDIGPKGPDNVSGYGIIDLRKMNSAVNALVRTRKAAQ